MTKENTLRINYTHLGKVLAEKVRKRMLGYPVVHKRAIAIDRTVSPYLLLPCHT